MEFLTFAPDPLRGASSARSATPRPAQWDALSRDAGIVSGLERWRIGLRAFAAEQRVQAAAHDDPDRKARLLRKADDADALRAAGGATRGDARHAGRQRRRGASGRTACARCATGGSAPAATARRCWR